jgi:hypothetical protein
VSGWQLNSSLNTRLGGIHLRVRGVDEREARTEHPRMQGTALSPRCAEHALTATGAREARVSGQGENEQLKARLGEMYDKTRASIALSQEYSEELARCTRAQQVPPAPPSHAPSPSSSSGAVQLESLLRPCSTTPSSCAKPARPHHASSRTAWRLGCSHAGRPSPHVL